MRITAAWIQYKSNNILGSNSVEKLVLPGETSFFVGPDDYRTDIIQMTATGLVTSVIVEK